MAAQEGKLVHVGMEFAQEKDLSATLTRVDFGKNVRLLPTSLELWADRKETLSMEYIKLRQCKMGELRGIATVSRPDTVRAWRGLPPGSMRSVVAIRIGLTSRFGRRRIGNVRRY